ncbi:oleoyl-ACP hydrolase [Kitasatospora sp. MMS16-BH015]|uniref:thioesterase II family protein n=1 Tax=Kitasatospora sp. MMS16-BH015 TaxID=2018025 RepID=UPI000CA1B781|nr:alpha/beta fold hydrolase [Kitasatospora sp. MMS16-BH015]AUG80442.1 oleoyl-ACP hydrolase [Kitasatospora sp. MMS16-BH015]
MTTPPADGRGWLRRLAAPLPDVPRLICFPHAGGAASAFVPLARALAPEVELLAVQYPGRQDRRLEPPATLLTGMAEAVAAELRRAPARPYALFGHSMGALVAYETARLLTAPPAKAPAAGPVRLFVSGRSAPSLGPGPADLVRGDTELLDRIRLLGGTSGAVFDDPELLALVLPVLRADYLALSGYRWTPQPPLPCPLTALVGDADPVVPVEAAAGWLELTSAPAELEVFGGGHFYLDGAVEQLAKVIRTALQPA